MPKQPDPARDAAHQRDSFYDGVLIGVLLGSGAMALLFALMAVAGVYGG